MYQLNKEVKTLIITTSDPPASPSPLSVAPKPPFLPAPPPPPVLACPAEGTSLASFYSVESPPPPSPPLLPAWVP